MTPGPYHPARPDRVAAQNKRDAAFARLRRVRGASVLGAGALTAAVAAVVSAIAPGHTLGAAKTHPRTRIVQRTQPSAPALPTHLPALASPRQLGLQGPAGAPQSAPAAPQSAPAAPQPAPATPTPQSSAPAPSQQSSPAVSGGS